jgi:rSAM/selenodomain-associated transferase 1
MSSTSSQPVFQPTVQPYPILSPLTRLDSATSALRATQCALVVMAKAPRPGNVKTRLSPPFTPEQAAELNICFLKDTTQNLANIATSGRAVGLISYTPVGDEALFNELLPSIFSLIPQRGDSFGERLFLTAQDVLACGYGSVCLIDSDSPTVPTAAINTAIAALSRPGDRVVLGPSNDGGYYLIGLKRPHRVPFQNINWSTSTVAAETRARCNAAYIDLVELPLWYDVDDQFSLKILAVELLEDVQPDFTTAVGYPAPYTLAKLRELAVLSPNRTFSQTERLDPQRGSQP